MSDTATMPEEIQPTEAPPPPPQPKIVVERLETLDRDYDGESKFCLLAVSSLRSFLARHENDIAVEDSYGKAIAALEAMPQILAGAHDRHTGEVTRKVGARLDAVVNATRAKQQRDYADQWTANAPPLPSLDAAMEDAEVLPDVLRTQFDPDPVPELPAGLSDKPPTPTDAAATPPPQDF